MSGAGAPTVSTVSRPLHRAVKRGIDLAVGVGVLTAALPLLAVTAAAIWLEDGGPVLFRQTRVGKDGIDFAAFKFRSMRVNTLPPEAVGQVREDHHLVTRTGRVIRRLKVDELPQLINVVRGDMSLVGPRPTIREQVERYDSFQRRRLLVPPGMTGWAQVNGNTHVSWDDRIRLDVWYVDHWSLGLDLRILAKTLGVILLGERPDSEQIATARQHADRSGWRG